VVLNRGVRLAASGFRFGRIAISPRARAVLALAALVLPACDDAASRPAASSDAMQPDPAPARAVALTFDDLPGVFLDTSLTTARVANERLVATLVAANAHATGFVNESKLRGSSARAGLLDLWLAHGLDLGNHTYSHPDLHRTALADYQADVLRGEVVTRELMQARGLAPRWFRHPFLHTGRDTTTRRAFERFLAEHGYAVAPVTIDNYDYVWARAYDASLTSGDTAQATRVADEYVAYMDTIFGFHEAQSRSLFGREPAHVLLLHVNRLNADRMGDLLAMMNARDYAIVPLAEALEDSIYESEDGYVGQAGITWLHRWAITRGTPGSAFAGEPVVPTWVEALTR
jgi:peptidoglycan/xylan/chitin deacetylase (PgdA/CDA1 family)